jgi:hypothetical protein
MNYKRSEMMNGVKSTNIVLMFCAFIIVVGSIFLGYYTTQNTKLSQENAEYLSVIEEYSVKYSELESQAKDYKAKIKDYKSQIKEYETQIKEYKEKLETTTKPTTTKKVTTTKAKTTNNNSNFGVFKSYTDYRCLSRSSKQWQLQTKAYTDSNGLRKIGDAYLVALGSYYGTTLGTRYTVTLSNGSVFDIILCDSKQNRHTDSTNRVCLSNGSVLEFYVDSSAMPQKVRTMGSVSAIPYFSGSVVSIVKK